MTISIPKEKAVYSIKDNIHIVDYGKVPFNSDTTIPITIKEEGLSSLTTKATCGCTIANSEKVDENTYLLTAKYKDTNYKGMFTKTIIVTLNKNGETKTEKIKLTGQVV